MNDFQDPGSMLDEQIDRACAEAERQLDPRFAPTETIRRSAPRPIVDLTPKPSRARRLWAWLAEDFKKLDAYEPRTCHNDVGSVISFAVIALVIAVAIAAAVVAKTPSVRTHVSAR